jgi:hypothetical protein
MAAHPWLRPINPAPAVSLSACQSLDFENAFHAPPKEVQDINTEQGILLLLVLSHGVLRRLTLNLQPAIYAGKFPTYWAIFFFWGGSALLSRAHVSTAAFDR